MVSWFTGITSGAGGGGWVGRRGGGGGGGGVPQGVGRVGIWGLWNFRAAKPKYVVKSTPTRPQVQLVLRESASRAN